MDVQATPQEKPTFKERLAVVTSALQHRNYRLYFTGLLFSVTGFQMLLVIQGWLIWDITGDPKALAYLGGVTAVPTVFLNLYGGVIADRLDQRLLIMIVSVTIGLLLVVMGLLVSLDMVNLWNLLFLSFLIAGAQAFDNPARQALYPHLIARKDLMNAVALNSIVWQGTRVVGPFIAGVMIASVGAGPALFLGAVGFAGMVAAMAALRVPPIARAAHGSMVNNLIEGIRLRGKEPDLRRADWSDVPQQLLRHVLHNPAAHLRHRRLQRRSGGPRTDARSGGRGSNYDGACSRGNERVTQQGSYGSLGAQ